MRKVVILIVAVVSLCLGSTEDKINKLSNEIGDIQRFAQVYYQRANLYTEVGSFAKAIEDFKKVQVFNADYKDVKYKMAKTYVNAGEAQLALDLSSELLSHVKDIKEKRRLLLVKADAYILQENYDEGIKLYEAQKKSKNGLNALETTKLAGAYYENAQSRKSLNVLKEALRKDKNNYLLSKKMVEVCIEEGSYSLAHTMIERMLEQKKNRAEIYYLQAQIFEAEDKVSLAFKSSKLAMQYLNKTGKNALKTRVANLELKLSQNAKNALALN